MDYKDTIENNLNEPFSIKAETLKSLPKKVLKSNTVSSKLSEGLDKLNEKVDGSASKIKTLIADSIDKKKLSLDSLVLIYLALSLVPPLLTMILSSIFIFSFLISWLLLIAIGIDIIVYILVLKLKEKLKNSSGSIVLVVLVSICEGIILSSLGGYIDSTIFAAELAILISSLLVAAIFANTLQEKYVVNSGRRIGIVVTINMFVLFLIFISSEFVPLVFFI